MDAVLLVIVSLSKQNYFDANILLRKILSSDLVTAHIRLKSSKNVESEWWLVPIKSRGMVVSCVWTCGLRELARVWGTITKFWV